MKPTRHADGSWWLHQMPPGYDLEAGRYPTRQEATDSRRRIVHFFRQYDRESFRWLKENAHG